MSGDNQNKRPRSEEQEGQDDWKNQPPYALENQAQIPKAVISGSCHCKDVTFDIYAEGPAKEQAHFCHCDTCQKLHGSAMHWSVVVPKNEMLFTCSPDKFAFYRTEDQKTIRELPAKLSCARCHSPIADEGRNMMLMYPSLFDFDKKEDRHNWLPRKHIFYSMRCIDVPDQMDKWEKMDGKSDKMDEEHHHGQKGVAGAGSKQDK